MKLFRFMDIDKAGMVNFKQLAALVRRYVFSPSSRFILSTDTIPAV